MIGWCHRVRRGRRGRAKCLIMFQGHSCLLDSDEIVFNLEKDHGTVSGIGVRVPWRGG